MDSCCSSPILDPALPLDLVALGGMGLLMSIGHCVGMCGPLLGAFAVAQRTTTPRGVAQRGADRRGDGHGRLVMVRALAVYHAGRLSSYVALGALLGLLSSATGLASNARPLQAGLSLAAGAVMLALGFELLGLLPYRTWLDSSRLARSLLSRFSVLLGATSPSSHYALGLLNGFLPCGPVYAAAIAATASGSLLKGALAMAAYGLGTVPALFVLGAGAHGLGLRLRARFFRVGAVLVLLIAVQIVLRGLAAVELVPHVHVASVVLW
ncbi:MAG: sulfite exporter TauE/SafE family protein [Planctomycetota bacterium]